MEANDPNACLKSGALFAVELNFLRSKSLLNGASMFRNKGARLMQAIATNGRASAVWWALELNQVSRVKTDPAALIRRVQARLRTTITKF
jgi:hypothetical protein